MPDRARPAAAGHRNGDEPLEVELKFLAAGPAPLQRLVRRRRLGPARLGPPRTVDEIDRYLDTADARLGAARWACRLRSRGERVIVSLKGPPRSRPTASGLHRRPEIEGPATESLDVGAWPASPARDRLLELSGGWALGERLALRQRRTQRAVTLDGRPIGELSLDRVLVTRGGRRGGTLWSVELELNAASAADAGLIAVLQAELQHVPDLAPDLETKLEHALAMLRHDPR